jgi:hypothetical protein
MYVYYDLVCVRVLCCICVIMLLYVCPQAEEEGEELATTRSPSPGVLVKQAN